MWVEGRRLRPDRGSTGWWPVIEGHTRSSLPGQLQGWWQEQLQVRKPADQKENTTTRQEFLYYRICQREERIDMATALISTDLICQTWSLDTSLWFTRILLFSARPFSS